MRIKFYSVCFVSLCLFSLKTFAQTGLYGNSYMTEMPNTAIDSNINGFIEVLPSDYNPANKYPLIIFMEGQSQFGNGSPTELKNLYGIPSVPMFPDLVKSGAFTNSYLVNSTTYKFIVLIPQARNQVQYNRPDDEKMLSPSEVNDVINYALQNYSVDVNRIYLMGLSLGGGSTWNYPGQSVAYGNRIAAIVPFAGASNLAYPDHSRVTNIVNENLPVWTFVAVDDPIYAQLGEDYIDSIKQVKYASTHTTEALITIYPTGNDHDATWIQPLVYHNTGQSYTDVFEWLLKYSLGANGRATQSQPVFPTTSAGSDQTINLTNGSMVIGTNGVSFTGASTTLTGSAPSGYNYLWVRVDGNGGTITNPTSLTTTVTNLMPGSYTYQLRVTDNTGLTAVSNVKVTVNAPPEHKYVRVEAEQYSGVTGAKIDRTLFDQGPAYGLGYLSPGNGATYNLSSLGLSAGTYSLFIRYSSPYGDPGVQITVDGTTTYNTNLTSYPYYPNPLTWYTSNNVDIVLGSNSTIQIQSLADQWAFDYIELAQISSSTLPVKFVFFNAQCDGSSVNLQWKTAQEQNTNSFSIQRSSDGGNWTEIGKTAAAGQSGGERSYAFVDKTASPNSMYRIVETDATGQQTFSSIVRSSCSSARNEVTLYPNPSAGNSALNVNLDQATSITMQVLDVKGAVMMQRQIQLPQGSNTVPVNLTNYPNGVYTIALRMNGETRTLKMIKK